MAIKDVTISTDTVLFDLSLPSINDSAAYHNPANYQIRIVHAMEADNSNDGAKDATFKGASIDFIVDTAGAEDIAIVNDGFTVKAGNKVIDSSDVTVNAKEQRISCLYIFSQMGASKPIIADIGGKANWEIGTANGDIPFGPVTITIQTNADSTTREFLNNAIAEGIFEEK